jgi:hypothetical protein
MVSLSTSWSIVYKVLCGFHIFFWICVFRAYRSNKVKGRTVLIMQELFKAPLLIVVSCSEFRFKSIRVQLGIVCMLCRSFS